MQILQHNDFCHTETIEKYLEQNPNLTEEQKQEALKDMEGADALSPEELGAKLEKYGAKVCVLYK